MNRLLLVRHLVLAVQTAMSLTAMAAEPAPRHEIAVLTTRGAVFRIDATGSLCGIDGNGRNYVPPKQPAPVLQLCLAGKYPDLAPELNAKQQFRGNTARAAEFGSVLQAYARDRRQSRTTTNWGVPEFVIPPLPGADAEVTPTPDPRLAQSGSAVLTADIDKAAKEIPVESPKPFATLDKARNAMRGQGGGDVVIHEK